MKKMILQFPKDLSSQARNALLIIAIYLGAASIAAILLIVQLITAPSWQLWAAEISIFLVAISGSIAMRLAWRGRFEAGVWIITSASILTALVLTATFSGLGIILFLCAVILNSLVAILALQSRQATFMTLIGIVSGVLILLGDLYIPTQRLSISGLQILVYVLSAILVLLFGYFIVSQFRRYGIGTKLLLSVLVTTGLSMAIFGFFTYVRTQQSEAFLTGELENTVRQQSEQQLNNTAQFQALLADQTLASVANEVEKLAEHQAALFNQQSILGQGTYWDAHAKILQLSGGQYGNSASDVASVFVPNTVTLTEEMISDINTSAYLDFAAPAILGSNPEIVAVYFIGAGGYSTYYPNIDLASAVSPDFDLLSQPFYTIATPQENAERQVVWTKPYQDPAGTGLIVTSSAPVYHQNGVFKGIVSADIQLSGIAEKIAAIKVGETGFAFLTASTGHIITMPEAGMKFFSLPVEDVPVGQSPRNTVIGHGSVSLQAAAIQMLESESGLEVITHNNTQYYYTYATVPSVGYRIGLVVPVAEMDSPFLATRERITAETQATVRLALIILLVILLFVAGVSFLLGRLIGGPLLELTYVAERISEGNLTLQARVHSEDESGRLATAFNKMTSQLRDLIGSLERRVADRTRNLELASQVGRSVSQVRDLESMLREAAESIRSRFDLYYTQVYLTNPKGSELILSAGTGSVGRELLSRKHRLQVNAESINGRAAIEKQPVIIADTAASSTFRPNPLLPDTRSEMAVPLIVGENIVGVLDLQSRTPGALSLEMLPAFEAVAGQLTIAIQNAKLVADANEARAEMEKQARHLVRTNWDSYLDAIYRPEQTGFIFENNQLLPLMQDVPSVDPDAVSAPIALAGEELGSLVVELDEEQRTHQNVELVNTIARQVAQQIESLRLLQNAEQYRHEAEEAVRRHTTEGWQQYIHSRTPGKLGYIYDTREVRPLSQEQEKLGTSLPIKVRDAAIGNLSFPGMDELDNASLEVVNAVLERLGTHIETLRQYDQTQSALSQSETLFQASSRLTQAANLQELVKAIAETMHIPVVNRIILDLFNYNEAGDLESMDVAATWWSGAGHEATPIGTHYSMDMLHIMPVFLSPTALYFTDALSDERFDQSALQMANSLRIRSGAILPLRVGSRQVGILFMQAEEPHTFTSEETRLFEVLAPQITTVLENRRQYERAQKQAEREAMLNIINQKIQSATSVEAVLQVAARELGRALGAPMTIAQLSMKEKSS